MTQPRQLSLPLPPPPADADTPLVPARMVNEWVYCPRLAYLEWVEGEWAESGDTAEGRRAHVRVDEGGGRLPEPDELGEERARARSVTLSSERLGVIAKMDVVETERRPGHARGLQEGQAAPRRRRRLRARARPALRPGHDPGGQWLQGRAGRPLVRGLARAGGDRPGRGAARPDPGGDHGPALQRGLGPPAAAAGGQPQVPALFAGRDLPARRDQSVPQGIIPRGP